MNKNKKLARDMLDFIKNSPSCFHAVKNISEKLIQNGFLELSESQKWNLQKGNKYFVTRNSSSVIAFTIPENEEKNSPFMICAGHSDSPSFKLKENPEISSSGCVVLNVEKYGGMLIAPWFDRPLSVAGRIIVKTDKGLKQILVDIDRDLLMIPNLAIHMNREANDGHKIDVQNEVRPVLSLNENTKLLKIIAHKADVSEQDILSFDLFLYNRCEPGFWGAEDEFISSTKLDDLECAYSTLEGFLQSCKEDDSKADFNANICNGSRIKVYCVFDNEEVGSQSRQGAASTFLSDTLERINSALGSDTEDYKIRLAKSFMVSADNAHAVHPNYANLADPVNRPKINGGVVIKFNASQKYTSDSISAGFFKDVCKRAGVPFQIFTNNSNIAGGSTLGNISQSQVSVSCVDIGLAQWAMHSPYETAGTADVEFMAKAIKEFYNSRFCLV